MFADEALSPEQLSRLPYGRPVDWWALGCLSHELVMGYSPFENGGTPMKTWEEAEHIILGMEVELPADAFSEVFADFVFRLLIKEPEERLGTRRGVSEIKEHVLFDGCDWTALKQKAMQPPYLPCEISRAGDRGGACEGEHELAHAFAPWAAPPINSGQAIRRTSSTESMPSDTPYGSNVDADPAGEDTSMDRSDSFGRFRPRRWLLEAREGRTPHSSNEMLRRAVGAGGGGDSDGYGSDARSDSPFSMKNYSLESGSRRLARPEYRNGEAAEMPPRLSSMSVLELAAGREPPS